MNTPSQIVIILVYGVSCVYIGYIVGRLHQMVKQRKIHDEKRREILRELALNNFRKTYGQDN